MARAAARRRRLGEHVQPLRPGVAVRRLQGVRLRPRGRPARARAVLRFEMRRFRLPCCCSTHRLGSATALRERDEPAAGQEDLQALHRRRVPALRVGPHVRGRGPERRARLAQGRCATPSAPRARRSPKWAAMTAYNRGQVLYRLAEMMETRSAELAAALLRRRRRSSAAIDRVGLVRGLGRQARAGARLARTRSPGRTSTSRCPSRPASSRVARARASPRSAGLVSRLAPVIVGGNAAVVVASETHPLAAIELAEVLATSDVPGGVVNILTGLQRRARADPRRAHGRERDRPHRRRRPRAPSSSGSPPTTSSASCAERRTGRARGRSRASSSSRPSGTRSASRPSNRLLLSGAVPRARPDPS